MNDRRSRELRQLATARPPIKGAVPTSTIIAGEAVVIIKGSNPRKIYRALKKNYRLVERGTL